MTARFRILAGGGAAWRARYLMAGRHQLARVVLDPHDGVRPTLTVALPIGWRRSCAGILCPRLLVLRLPMPRIPWSWCARTGYARPVLALYRASNWFWHGVDGRYGWGGSCRREVQS